MGNMLADFATLHTTLQAALPAHSHNWSSFMFYILKQTQNYNQQRQTLAKAFLTGDSTVNYSN